ncbi:glycosyltransferase family 4 protein [Flavobacterium franklandianum]|uniref:Glycosyltransferase family 4 protein n=1 Tax=Flavobacterium franklandianum TaxID=2594430 RepID=A0A553CK94_9FLAO|nr:glycosyltransferase family 4 protein [Flavobacterium franklandianum]TRX20915.1 glycosyltransferase family 4 protein [Flavobacterium franklandianum]TRX23143.1 glycosyltransferase family 4 protein [Flavobacterium franklandianum]
MKFLVIEQDLRVWGTSQGIISRSFLAKLRKAYPQSIIDVVYLKQSESEDCLDLLPVNSIKTYVLDLKIPFYTKLFNKFYWRFFHVSLIRNNIHKVFGSYITKIDYQQYDHIFIRSAGLDCETILGAKDLSILKKSIITFNEPYPTFWCTGSISPLTNLELFKVKEMFEVVNQAKSCMATEILSEDLQYLYGSRKKFYNLPHQYDESVFDLSKMENVYKKNKKIMISYQGAIQFGRNVEILLDAYQELLENNLLYIENTEFVLRLKGIDKKKLVVKYSKCSNIKILDFASFSDSCNEQMHQADINIILENGPLYCNVLVGKAPFLAATQKPILSISPERSEMQRIITDPKYIANCNDKEEIKQKLEILIVDRLNSDAAVFPFGDYFSEENFKKLLDAVLFDSSGHS